MSNWAALQEQLVDLPVAKRAKHGIHFQKGANEFVANFSGKPCHYEDGGIWKPIDTKLILLPDGFYGCPHSPVRVHSDGRVKVEGTDYVQQAALPSAKTGLADGDKLIREFSFGKQEMRITENGFKSEITLNRIPTLTEARKLIASESGTLSKKYLKSLTTATDANGDVHTVSTLTAFRTWLASAKFPVVIDPDFSVQPDATAGLETLLNGTSGNEDKNYGVFTNFLCSSSFKSLIKFDLSSIGAGSVLSSSVVSLYCYAHNSANGISYSMYRMLTQWYEGNKNGATADGTVDESTWNYRNHNGSVVWGTGGGTPGGLAGTDYESAATVSTRVSDYGAWYTWDINADAADWVSGDATNYGNILFSASGTYKRFYSSDYTDDTSLRPKLVVTYTAAGTFIPINMNAQMQSLTGNMRG